MSNHTDGTRAGISAEVRRFIDENALLKKGDGVIVALSGGADSVCLLHILISLKEEYDLSISAAHFNHGIRGEEADRDERFVSQLCESRGIPLFCEKADVPAAAAESCESLELCGRRLRYRFLERIARDRGGAKIATAHHGGDNAETVLWNLTRGAGIGGLSGIPVRRGDIIRPLLCLTRADIEAYCRENDLAFVTDSTNLSDDYTRNKLRHRVMPVLRELNPNAEENIGRTAALMGEADDYLNKNSLKELKTAKTQYGWPCEKLLMLDPIVLKYAVKNILEIAGAPVDFRHIALIIEAMHRGGTVDLGQGFVAVCAQGTLRVIRKTADHDGFCIPFAEFAREHCRPVRVHGGKAVIDGAVFDCNDQKINSLLLYNGIPCDIITPETVYRTRRAGDTFTDARRGVTKTIKKLMNELKIPREERDTVELVADGSVVLWLSGDGVSAQAKADLSRDGEYYLINGGQNDA